MSHYDTLGVPPAATPDEIKQAFRRQAKDAHPDREGGSTEKMAMVNRAYEVLSSPAKREQYDRTGTDADPQSIESQARDMLLQMISKVLEGSTSGILPELKQMLKMNRQGISANHDQHKARIRKLEKARGKVRVKKGDDLVEMLISEQLGKCHLALEQMQQATRIMNCADAMLAYWEEDAPTPTQGNGIGLGWPYAQQQSMGVGFNGPIGGF